MTKYQDHEESITFDDLKRVFLRHRGRIKTVALACGMAVFLFLLFLPPHYQVEATFKLSRGREESSVNMKEIFQRYMAMPAENATIAVMQSNEVLKGAIEEWGMQVVCKSEFFLMRIFRVVKNNLALELGFNLPDREKFAFRNVSYLGEEPLSLYFRLNENGTYELCDKDKKILGAAKLGQAVQAQACKLTLSTVPANAKIQRFYPLVINAWVKTADRVRKKLKIFPHRLDKGILQLKFFCADRFLGAEFLNRLMLGYQEFLKKENDEICQKQLEHLQTRQRELTTHYDQALAEHAAYLRDNLDENGFIGFAQEIQTLSEPKNFYTSKLFDVDLELKRLKGAGEAFASVSHGQKDVFPKVKKPRPAEKKESEEHIVLANQRKVAQGRLDSCELEKLRCEASTILPIKEEILHVDAQIKEATLLLEGVETRGELPNVSSLLKEPKSAVALLAKQIALAIGPLKEGSTLPRGEYIAFLQALIGQLQQKRQILEDDIELQAVATGEFSGLNLSTAQGLLVDYTRQRDSLQAQTRELVFLRDQLSRPDFEVSSLGGVFEDGVTRDLVNRASEVALQLKDENNRSLREQERLLETLQTQKNFLSEYLVQTVELKKLRATLLGDKISSLQRGALSLLESEKDLLGNKLQELNTKMSVLPEKWRRESLLLLQKEIGAMMLEGIFQLTESKYLDQHIFQCASKPLDRALAPIRPKLPRLFLLSIGAVALAGLVAFCAIFSKAVVEGLPVTEQSLKRGGLPVSGKLSPSCTANLAHLPGEDLETLRYLAKFVGTHKKEGEGACIVCIGGKYPDFSTPLAELLGMQGLRSIVVQGVFDKVVHPEDVPGLWQYVHGKAPELPLRRYLTHDLIPSGGASRHGLEIVLGTKFQELLSRLKQKYDIVLLYSSADASKAEGLSLLGLADAAIVTTQQETKDQLFGYKEWMEMKGQNSGMFVYASESLS